MAVNLLFKTWPDGQLIWGLGTQISPFLKRSLARLKPNPKVSSVKIDRFQLGAMLARPTPREIGFWRG